MTVISEAESSGKEQNMDREVDGNEVKEEEEKNYGNNKKNWLITRLKTLLNMGIN